MVKTIKSLWVNSLWAGILIAISSAIYLNCPNKLIGAILFSFGLITILEYGCWLFTGVVGFVRDFGSLRISLIALAGNLIGCFAVLLLPTRGAAELMTVKLSTPWCYVFGKAIVCGIIVYSTVRLYKSGINKWHILIAVPAFIICGAEHSIADACYIIASHQFTLQSLIFLLIVIVGNAIGALTMSLSTEYCDKIKTKKEN